MVSLIDYCPPLGAREGRGGGGDGGSFCGDGGRGGCVPQGGEHEPGGAGGGVSGGEVGKAGGLSAGLAKTLVFCEKKNRPSGFIKKIRVLLGYLQNKLLMARNMG